MTRARYEIVAESTDDTLVIRDVGAGSCMSVTNDAEEVVLDVYRRGMLVKRRLLYYDSSGALDELCHDGQGGFVGFRPVRNRLQRSRT